MRQVVTVFDDFFIAIPHVSLYCQLGYDGKTQTSILHVCGRMPNYDHGKCDLTIW